MLNLFRFLDWLLKLPKGLEAEFWQELSTYEEERRMPYVTSVERIGIEKGKTEGQRSFALHLLNHKFGELPDRTITQIDALSTRRIKQLGEALLDFSSIANLISWLETHSS